MSIRSAILFACVSVIGLLVFVAVLDGCRPVAAPDVDRVTARAAVDVTTDALQRVDAACASYVTATGDRAIGARCVDFYREARIALIGAAVAVDAWDKIETRRSVTCAAVEATRGMALLARELADKGAPAALKVVDDSLALVARLGVCVEEEGGAP